MAKAKIQIRFLDGTEVAFSPRVPLDVIRFERAEGRALRETTEDVFRLAWLALREDDTQSFDDWLALIDDADVEQVETVPLENSPPTP